jgi:serine/threonine protein kinase
LNGPPKVIKRGKTKGTKYVELDKLSLFEKTFTVTSSFGCNTAYRDLFFFKHLAAHQITPEVRTVSQDEKKQSVRLYMESFPLDLDEYCVEYAKMLYKKHLPGIAKPYRFQQIIPDYLLHKVFALVLKLDQHKVVHGDLKPSQFLYSPMSTEIRLTDYGFAGFQDSKEIPPMLGWPVSTTSLGCQTFKHQDNESETLTPSHVFAKLSLLNYLNRWELDVAFWMCKIGVYDTLSKEIKPYGRLSFDLLPAQIHEQFHTFCKGPVVAMLQERMTKVQARTHYVLSECKADIV